ncbi:MAG: methyltransferase domain-containing protein [Phycisphaerales bacterium]|nr:methyltransferase domain-containing protein [Phycisphaerales bacterium]
MGLSLAELRPTSRFTDRAGDYVRSRPDYPWAAWRAIVAGLPPPAWLVAADVGAGTGISSRQLASLGVGVTAVEPNAAMREAASDHPLVRWVDAPAEATTLGGGSVNLVVVAQAFHWFRAEEALGEFRRILTRRPGAARLAVMWNVQDETSPVGRRYLEIVERYAVEAPQSPSMRDPNPSMAGRLSARRGWGGYRELVFTHAQRLDRPGLVGRALSASYSPKHGPAFEAMREELAVLFDEASDRGTGLITLPYRTHVHLAEPLR